MTGNGGVKSPAVAFFYAVNGAKRAGDGYKRVNDASGVSIDDSFVSIVASKRVIDAYDNINGASKRVIDAYVGCIVASERVNGAYLSYQRCIQKSQR
jgi:hypothetical protein